jgi:hypothetical protein
MQESDKTNWGVMVPSQPTGGVQYGPHLPNYVQTMQQQQQQQQQDDDLSLAISASLRSSMLDSGSSPFVTLPLVEQIRPTPFFPVTLRSRSPRFVYIAMLMQAMYQIPHIRIAFMGLESDNREESLQPFWEAMGRMDMGIQRDIHLDDLLHDHIVGDNDENALVKDIKESVSDFYSQFATEMCGHGRPFPSRLLVSQIWQPPSLARSSFGSNTDMWVDERTLADTGSIQDFPVIPITSNVNSEENSLLLYLHDLTWSRKLQVAADVLVFSITHEEGLPDPSIYKSTPTTGSTNGKGTSSNTSGKQSGPSQKYPLKYPAQLYVDPFMLDNHDIAKIQRDSQIKMQNNVHDIEKTISALGGGTVSGLLFLLFGKYLC